MNYMLTPPILVEDPNEASWDPEDPQPPQSAG